MTVRDIRRLGGTKDEVIAVFDIARDLKRGFRVGGVERVGGVTRLSTVPGVEVVRGVSVGRAGGAFCRFSVGE